MNYPVGTVLDWLALKKELPVSYPMLLLDRVLVESEKKLIGVKNLCANELFFQGHFPNHPIMPGVLQVEAMRQLAELAVQDVINPDKTKQVYMRVLEKVKFRKPNLPGDRVKIEAEVTSVENGEAVVNCVSTNNSGVTSQAVITLAARAKTAPTQMPVLFNEYDQNAEICFDTTRIMDVIPHRYPFLLIDNVIKASDGEVVVTKNVSGNEELFQSRDDFATLPEALLCEIVAQAGCTYLLSRPEHAGKLGYFMSIDHAESFLPVFPGDQLVIRTQIPVSAKSRFGKGTGVISVDGRDVFKVSLMFAIVDPQ